MEPWPVTKRQVDRLSLPVDHDHKILLSDIVVPILNVGLEAPTVPGTGPRIRPMDIDAAGALVERSAAAILAAVVAALAEQVDQNSTVIETVIATDGAGDSVDVVVPAPAVGYHLVITSLRVNGVNLNGGTMTFDTIPASVLSTGRCASGRASSIIDAILPTATALTCTTLAGGNTVTYWIEVCYKTVAD